MHQSQSERSRKGKAPRTKSAVLPPELPDRSRRPATGQRQSGRGLWTVLLVILPLLVAAGALVAVPKRYMGELVDSYCPPDPDRFVPTRFAVHTLLLDFGWKFAHERRFAEVGSVADVSNDWALIDRFTECQWAIHLTAPSRKDCIADLSRFSSRFRTHVEEVTGSERDRLAEKERNLSQEISDLSDALAAIDTQIAAAPQEIADNTLLSQLAEANNTTRQHWGQYTELRDRLAAKITNRDNLQNAPPIENAVVDVDARETAYEQSTPLQEDMRHLEIQLFQIKSTMIAIAEDGRASLDAILSASKSIGNLTESAAAENASATERPLLEQTAEKALENHHHATLFAQAWTRDLLQLKELEPNARTAEILGIYDEASKRIRDFQQVSEQSIATLRRRVRTLGEQADPDAATHVAQASLVRSSHELQAAVRTFDGIATDLIAQDNYLLDAALQSARGLWQRTQATRRDIDHDLQRQAIQRARDERAARIATMTDQIATLRSELMSHIDSIMVHSDAAVQIADRLPAFVTAATAGVSARDRRVLLESRLDELRIELNDVQVQTAGLVNLEELKFDEPEVMNWPANLVTVIGAGTLAWSLSFLGLFGIMRLTSRSR